MDYFDRAFAYESLIKHDLHSTVHSQFSKHVTAACVPDVRVTLGNSLEYPKISVFFLYRRYVTLLGLAVYSRTQTQFAEEAELHTIEFNVP